jgi:FixJ family two-component response regulator
MSFVLVGLTGRCVSDQHKRARFDVSLASDAYLCARFDMADDSNAIRVFVIDDDEGVCAAVCLMLRDAGFVVSSAISLGSALGAIAAFSPQVIVTDLQMPGSQDGGVVGVLHSYFPTLAIIATSGSPHLQPRALKLGANAFLPKPLRRGAVGECINALAQGGDLDIVS